MGHVAKHMYGGSGKTTFKNGITQTDLTHLADRTISQSSGVLEGQYRVYSYNFNEVIGSAGETSMKIIVSEIDGANVIVTMYPY